MLLFAKDLVKPVLIKMGWIKNGNGIKDIDTKITAIEENHLTHLETKIDKMLEQNTEIIYILKDFKDDGIRIKK